MEESPEYVVVVVIGVLEALVVVVIVLGVSGASGRGVLEVIVSVERLSVSSVCCVVRRRDVIVVADLSSEGEPASERSIGWVLQASSLSLSLQTSWEGGGGRERAATPIPLPREGRRECGGVPGHTPGYVSGRRERRGATPGASHKRPGKIACVSRKTMAESMMNVPTEATGANPAVTHELRLATWAAEVVYKRIADSALWEQHQHKGKGALSTWAWKAKWGWLFDMPIT